MLLAITSPEGFSSKNFGGEMKKKQRKMRKKKIGKKT